MIVMAETSSTTPPSNPPTEVAPKESVWRTIGYYADIARPDHWIKNAFMVLGILLAFFYRPETIAGVAMLQILWAFVATCLLASSNYVINEILDAVHDLSHPVKRFRPIPSGKIDVRIAYAEWFLLAVAGLAMAYWVNLAFFFSGAFLLVMGLIYNVPPIRSKDLPYLDVLSESINNPIRLLLGWFALIATEIPPTSLLISYWMIGAFFMASKRFAEMRSFTSQAEAGAYRKSFKHYDDSRLMASMMCYVTCFAVFLGVFIIRYHLELILACPLVAGFIGYYTSLSFSKDSATQAPERLYKESALMIYLCVCVAVFLFLMFIEIPGLYAIFNVPASNMPSLWKF